MSMGGDFYAISDQQLKEMLDGKLDYASFLYNELEEKPRECYSKGETVWFELTQLLSHENACGTENTYDIPEASGYSFSTQVSLIAQALSRLDETELRDRYNNEDIEESFDTIFAVIKDLIEFYQRAAMHNDAVLFRLT